MRNWARRTSMLRHSWKRWAEVWNTMPHMQTSIYLRNGILTRTQVNSPVESASLLWDVTQGCPSKTVGSRDIVTVEHWLGSSEVRHFYYPRYNCNPIWITEKNHMGLNEWCQIGSRFWSWPKLMVNAPNIILLIDSNETCSFVDGTWKYPHHQS